MWKKILISAVMLTMMSASASAAIKCRAAPGSDGYYAWRSIDGKKCWYKGPRGMAKSNLRWEKKASQVVQSRVEELETLVADQPSPAAETPAPAPLILAHLVAAPGNLPPVLAPVETVAQWPETFGQRWVLPSTTQVAAPPPPAARSAQFAIAAITGSTVIPAMLGWVFFLWQGWRAERGQPVPREWLPHQLVMKPGRP